MTDYTELIARLRTGDERSFPTWEAADALTAQAARIAELTDLLSEARDDSDCILAGMLPNAGYKRWDDRIAAQRDLLARIDAALASSEERKS